MIPCVAEAMDFTWQWLHLGQEQWIWGYYFDKHPALILRL